MVDPAGHPVEEIQVLSTKIQNRYCSLTTASYVKGQDVQLFGPGPSQDKQEESQSLHTYPS